MEQKLYFGITTPSAILATLFGIWLLSYNWQSYMTSKMAAGQISVSHSALDLSSLLREIIGLILKMIKIGIGRCFIDGLMNFRY